MDRRSGYEYSSKLYVHRVQVPEKNCNHESGTGVIGKRLAKLILPRRGRGGKGEGGGERLERSTYIDLGNELRYVQNLLISHFYLHPTLLFLCDCTYISKNLTIL